MVDAERNERKSCDKRKKTNKKSLSIHRNIVPLHPILNKTIE